MKRKKESHFYPIFLYDPRVTEEIKELTKVKSSLIEIFS